MKTLRYIFRGSAWIMSAAFLGAAMLLGSCSDDDGASSEAPYLYIEGDQYAFDFDAEGNVGKDPENKDKYNSLDMAYSVPGCSKRLALFSNMGEWRIETQYTEDTKWVDVFPARGENDGRFWLTVDRNTTGYSRVATVNVIAQNRVVRTLEITQKPGTASIEIDMEGMTSFAFPIAGAEREIRIKSNVGWKPIAESEAAGWISFAEQTEQSVKVIVAENHGEASRKGVVAFVMSGTGNDNVAARIEINQKGQASNFERAELRTIAQILAEAEGGAVKGNVYVEATVVSDPDRKNADPAMLTWTVEEGKEPMATLNNRFMWVQDDSGRGLLLEFEDAAENTYKLGDKMKIHLVEQHLMTDGAMGGVKISGITSEEIPETLGTGSVAPVALDDFSQVEQYENTLVKIAPVEFALTMGTYVNINESVYNNDTKDGRIDGPAQYAQVLRDRNGRTMLLYTASSFVDRFKRLIPKGSGPLTALVVKNIVAGKTQTVLRLRSDADNAVSDDASTRLSTPVVEFGPWLSNAALTSVSATTGEGSLKTSMFRNVVEKQSDAIYWGWTYARRAAATVAEDGTVTPAQPATLTADYNFPCLNTYGWWEGNGTSIRDASGEAWIATVSTAKATGKLQLVFSTSSSASGPREFQIEWTAAEEKVTTDDKGNEIYEQPALSEFQAIGTYTVGNWNANYQCKEMVFDLPDEIRGHDKVIIRHRVIANTRANGKSGTIGNTGTNRIGYWGIWETK